ncbi:hypothetical protein [Labrenzia sp. CP4]|jgi:hypothetical protein|nr:hypothetical protein [Labrenzia sp. CP4]
MTLSTEQENRIAEIARKGGTIPTTGLPSKTKEKIDAIVNKNK